MRISNFVLILFLIIACGWCAPPEELRRRIADTLFVPNPQPALSPVSYGSFEPAPGVVAERISYATENYLHLAVRWDISCGSTALEV